MLKIILFLNYMMNKKCNFTDFVHYTILKLEKFIMNSIYLFICILNLKHIK